MMKIKESISLLMAGLVGLSPLQTWGASNSYSYQHTFGMTSYSQNNQKGYGIQIDANQQKAIIQDLENSSRPTILEMPFSTDEALQKNSLEKIAKSIQFGQTSKEVAIKLLPETTLFLAALGAGVTLEMMFSQSSVAHNPMAGQQLIESQLSPLGLFGFYAFMHTSKTTENILQAWFQGKNNSFIPYAGMSLGFYAQSMISSMMTDSNFQDCYKSLVYSASPDKLKKYKSEKAQMLNQGEVAPSCREAFKAYVWEKRIWESVPGLVSMLGSMAIAGGIQAGIRASVLITKGFDIAILFAPGGFARFGIKALLAKGAQIAAFMNIQEKILNKPITWIWKNHFDGNSLGNINDELLKGLAKNHLYKWQNTSAVNSQSCSKLNRVHDCDMDFGGQLIQLSEKMKEWRQFNLMSVYEAHNNWQQYLDQLLTEYNLSSLFYQDLIGEIRAARYPNLGLTNRVDQLYPFYGLRSPQVTDEKSYWDSPGMAEESQLYLINQIGNKIKSDIDTKKVAPSQKRGDAGLDEEAFAKLVYIKNGLLSKDKFQKSDALNVIMQTINSSSVYQLNLYNLSLVKYLKQFQAYFSPAFSPKNTAGSGFFEYYKKFGAHAAVLDQSEKSTTYIGRIKTRNAFENYMVKTLCGADMFTNTHLVVASNGFPASFSAPKLISNFNSGNVNYLCNTLDASEIYEFNSFFNFPKDIKIPLRESKINLSNSKGLVKQSEVIYKNLFSLLRDQIDPKFLGGENDLPNKAFNDQWNLYVEPQVKAAFQRFASTYEQIVVDLRETVFDRSYNKNSNRSAFNQGPAANTVIDSLFQELKVYLVVLGELAKDTYQIQNGKPIPPQFVSAQKAKASGLLKGDLKSDYLPFLSLLDQRDATSNYDLKNILQSAQQFIQEKNKSMADLGHGNYVPQAYLNPNLASLDMLIKQSHFDTQSTNLQFQNEIEYQFRVLAYLLQKIQVKKDSDGVKHIRSTLKPDEIQKQVQLISNKIAEVAQLFDLKTDSSMTEQSQNPSLVQLSEGQKIIANLAVQKIASIAQEMSLYASIAQTMDFETLKNSQNEDNVLSKQNKVELREQAGLNPRSK